MALPVHDAMGPRLSPLHGKNYGNTRRSNPGKRPLSPFPFVDGGVACAQVKTFFTREHRFSSRVYSFLDNLMLPFTSCAYIRLIVVGGRASPRERSHAKDPIVAARCTCMHACVAPCYETRTSVAPASYLANEGFSPFLFFFLSSALFFPARLFSFLFGATSCVKLRRISGYDRTQHSK